MFKCFKKKEVVEETKYYIPEKYVMEICVLSDLTENPKKYRSAQFKLWSAIQSIFPSLKIKEGGWVLTFENATNIYIKKRVTLN